MERRKDHVEKEGSTPEKRNAKLINDLLSRNERLIIGALQKIPHEGSNDMIGPMVALYRHNPNAEIRMLLEKVLHNLKDPSCGPVLVGLLHLDEYKPQRVEVLTAIWQSGLDVSEQLSDLIKVALQGDFITVLEVITVVENLDFTNDDSLTESIKLLDKAVEKRSETQQILGNLRQIILDKLLG